MSRVRLALRLARREVLRRPGRTALVALLVAIPVAGMGLAVTLIRSEADTPQEQWEDSNGQADAVAYDLTQPLVLPDGSRQVEYQNTYGRLKTVDGERSNASISTLPIDDPIAEGMFDLVAGRHVAADGEAVLTPALADAFGVGVGDTLRLERPDLELEVVGEAEKPSCLSCTELLVRTDLTSSDIGTAAFEDYVGSAALIDLPAGLTLPQLQALQAGKEGSLSIRELSVLDEFRFEASDPESVRWSFVLGAVVLVVVGIIISAAFAVGARRQLVTMGQLSASGAPPETIRTALVLQGTVTGLVGALVGLALAALLLVLGRDLIEQLLDQRLRGYEARPTELLVVLLIGVGAATGAALIPAISAARIPTLAALAGRRPLPPVSRRLVTWGAAGVVGGLALLFLAVLGSQGGSGQVWAYVAIAGGVFELFGACALAPAIVARLEPLSARLRGSLRLGARTLARHRARTGAVVSAVAAAGALAVVAGAAVLGIDAETAEDAVVPDDVVVATVESYGADGLPTVVPRVPAEVERELGDAFPTARRGDLRAAAILPNEDTYQDHGQYWEEATPYDDGVYLSAGWPYLADEAVLDAVRADDEVRSALEEHGIVILSAEAATGDAVMRAPDGREVPVRVVHHPYDLSYGGNLLVTPEAAEELGATVAPVGTLLRLAEPLTDADRDTLEDLSYDLSSSYEGEAQSEAYVYLGWQQLSSGPSPLQLELLLSGVALVFCLFVVGVSLALAAAEGKDERDILTIAGAPPATVARTAGARAWLMAVTGAAIAVPIGFLPVVVVSWASGQDPNTSGSFPIVFPARTVLLLLVVVPLVVCTVAWLASSTAQRLRPVRVSTATFE